MKKIGFIDLYISEWHANNYPAWIKKASEELGLSYEVCYAWAQEDVSPVDGKNTDTWCKEQGVTRCQTIEEICQKSDVLIILAPSNPEKHLEYASIVLPYGKPTYIDKPFSDTPENAREIFALAERYHTPFFSTSALRYATELCDMEGCVAMTAQGGGGSVEEYIIHQAEMVVKKLGVGATAVKAQRITDEQFTFTVRYADGRAAGMHFMRGAFPFAVTMSRGNDTRGVYRALTSDYFALLIKDILSFFETKKQSFDPEQTLEVNKLVCAAIKAKAQCDEWIAL